MLVTALQEAQAKGGGVIATMNLTTVQNKRYGIPAGVVTQVRYPRQTTPLRSSSPLFFLFFFACLIS